MSYFTGLLADQVESSTSFFPVDASTFAETNDWLFSVISWICVVFFIPIAGSLVWFMVKYTKPKGEKAESNVAHNTPLEVAWSVFPSFFLVAMFFLGAQAYLHQRNVPTGAYEVQVKAQKWGWGFDYGNGTISPELHIYKDRPVLLSMRSIDVIHSLYIPAFRAKKDIVPGRYNYMWFEASLASEKADPAKVAAAVKHVKDRGDVWGQVDYDEYQFTEDGYKFYDLYCTEYCGTNHSEMQAVVVVHETEEELEAWIKANSVRGDEEPAVYGKKLYQNRGCAGCHSIDGSSRVGPSFKNLYGTAAANHPLEGGKSVPVDENYVRESILYPKAKIVKGYPNVMPSYKGQLSDDDINSIIAFQKSISENTPAEQKTETSDEDSDDKSAEGSNDKPDEGPDNGADEEKTEDEAEQ